MKQTLTFFLAAVMWLISCDTKSSFSDYEEIRYSDEIQNMISQVSSGEIQPYDPIRVVFREEVVSEDQLNRAIKNPFSFSPGIEGKAMWVSTNEIILQPDKPLKTREIYSGKLSLAGIDENSEVNELPIKVYVNGREITDFSGELVLQNPSNPEVLVYQGSITFNQKTSLEDIQKAASLEGGRLSWNKVNDTRYSFLSEPLQRPEKSKNLLFKINGRSLGLSETLEMPVQLTPLNEMVLTRHQTNETGRKPSITLVFSDKLNEDQDINGFVRISPSVDFSIQKLGKNVLIAGDFTFGESYEVTVSKGITSVWGSKTADNNILNITFSDIPPMVQFVSSGIFMPTSNEKTLQFMTSNLRQVHVEIKKVLDDNVNRFFQRENVNSDKNRGSEFNQSYVTNIGAIIYNKSLQIGEEKNQWLVHNLDLSAVFEDYDNGLYLIRINFNPDDVIVNYDGDRISYIQQYGQIYKPITISDLGVIAKVYGQRNDNLIDVFVTDLKTGQPVQNAKVTAFNYYQSASLNTNNQGMVTVAGSRYSTIRVEKNGQFSMITPDAMRWNNSGFDVGGISEYELEARGYIYTERGVYRPGDTVNISLIARFRNEGIDNAPADLQVYDPQGTLVEEMTYTGSKDGFYNFTLVTEDNAPTGDWNVQIRVGNKYFYKNLKIETVVANRLKVLVEPQSKNVLPSNKQFEFDIESRYLFGAPANGLPYTTDVELFRLNNPFPKYQEFRFSSELVDFENSTSKIKEGRLDSEGKATLTWNVPDLRTAPGPLKARLKAAVSEEGGRPNEGWTILDLHPFTHYAGIKVPDRYIRLNAVNKIPVVSVDTEGNAVTGRSLSYRIYRNDTYWWYQYDNYRSFKLKFKSDRHSYIVEEGTLVSATPNAFIDFMPTERGEYLIEVTDTEGGGHTTGVFLRAYPYGAIPSGDMNSGTLTLRSEKADYVVGEEIKLIFPSPRQGNVLITVEKGSEILEKRWVKPDAGNEEMTVSLTMRESMSPNCYVTVTAIQEHAQTINDRPMRMFGILPVNVINQETKEELIITMDDELKPKSVFDVEVSTVSGRPTQFTIAVVDEGLLDLTNFQTPDPWKEFNRKIRLEVDSYDMFGHVIGAKEDDVFKKFSIGGDMDYRESQTEPFEQEKRFRPVSMFRGPIMTDNRGKATVHFEMPNYVGSVRVMVVAARNDIYGSAEKTVPVKSPLIIQPTLPRALKPGDTFTVPVNLFATSQNIGEVNLKIATEGPIEVVGSPSSKVNMSNDDNTLVYFELRAKEAIGQGKVTITGTGNDAEASFEAFIGVTPSSSREYIAENYEVVPGQTFEFPVPKIGVDGTNNARLQLALFPDMDFDHRLAYLIRYPYGCIEQTTSSVFPQLALKSFQNEKAGEIDRNINAGIDRLRRFQLSNGGFSYWPGGTEVSPWGTNYAALFLVEAKKAGYAVPETMYDGVLKYLERAARNAQTEEKYLTVRVNRCFVLAMAEKPPIQEMNLLLQNYYDNMTTVQRWMLITSYFKAGAWNQVSNLVDALTTEVEPYRELGNTYGSRNRDLGIILQCLVILNREQDALLMARYVAKELSGTNWMSTQTVGQMLLGMGSYFDYAGISSGEDIVLEGELRIGTEKFNFREVNNWQHYINQGYGTNASLKLNSNVNAEKLYLSVTANGVPLKSNATEQNKNLDMNITWYDEEGRKINIESVEQGTTIYGRYTISNTSVLPTLEEVALVQILPSGWEIENLRLNNGVLPAWTQSWNLNKEEYLDIRDDRIMWFFDISNGQPLDFVVKINAITKGNFTLPGARCEAMYDAEFVATKPSQKVVVR